MNTLIKQPIVTIDELRGLKAAHTAEIEKSRLEYEKRIIDQHVEQIRKNVLTTALTGKTVHLHDTRVFNIVNIGRIIDNLVDKVVVALKLVFPEVKICQDTSIGLDNKTMVNVIKIDWT